MTTIVPLLSIPSYFIIGGWVLRELILNKTEIKKLIFINIPVVIMSIIYCITAIIPQHTIFMEHFSELWGDGFISINIMKNINMFIHNFNYYFMPVKFKIIHLLLIFAGLYLLIKNIKEKETILLFSTILMFLICSALKIYPIYERICLYAFPIILIVLTKIFDIELLKNKIWYCFILIIFIISFNKYNLSYWNKCYNSDIWNVRFEEVPNPKALMKSLKRKYNGRDTIIINKPSQREYEYYKFYYNFLSPNETILQKHPKTKTDSLLMLDDITKPEKTYWFFYSCDYTDLGKDALKEWKQKYKILYEQDFGDSYILHLQKK